MDVSITLAQAVAFVKFLEPADVANWAETNGNQPAVNFSYTDKNGKMVKSTIATFGDVMEHVQPESDDTDTDPNP